jgi:DNA-binding beta-propeller fold protein YncE
MRLALLAGAAIILSFFGVAGASAQPANPPAGEYKVVQMARVGGAGGFDYVYADSAARRLYIPRGNRVTVFDLDSLKPVGAIPDTPGVHGAGTDPASGHGFCSSNPVVMWDTRTLKTLKTIPVQGNPDGILFDPATEHVFVLSHRAPNVTVIDAWDGNVLGSIDLGGAPEQAVSDGAGHVYVDLEDKDQVAVVDARTLAVTAHYDLGGKGGGPAGLAMDTRNHVLFVACRKPQNMVVMNAQSGKILAALPIGAGVDSAEFNPNTMEAFSSQRDGTLTVIKQTSPADFVVEQNVQTKPGAKTSTLDTQTNRIYLITAEQAPATQPAEGGRPGRRAMVPGSFTILVVGK